MWNSPAKLLIAIGLCLTIGVSWGCMGSSAYRLWYRTQWLEDEEIRPSLYTRLEQLHGVRAAELLKLHGVGPRAVRVLAEALAARGLSLAEDK